MEKFIIRSRAERQDECKYVIIFRKDTLYNNYSGLYVGVYYEPDKLIKMQPYITEVHIEEDKFYWKHKDTWYWLPTNKISYDTKSLLVDDLFYKARIWEHSMCREGDGTWMMMDYSKIREQIDDFNKEFVAEEITIVDELEGIEATM
jgi:hypothetical protein